MNIKKLFATLAGVSLFAQTVVPSASVFGAGYSQELEDAYNWAYGKSITTMSPIENANMYGAITRAEMAKMLANWAKDKGETPDTSKACNFSDTASVKGDLATAIVEACQLGLMGQGITSFRPYDTISRAEFGTALSRALWGNKYEGGTPYYTNHLNALKAAGIMTQIANAESTKEVRGYVMLMLMRSEGGSEVSEETDCEDPLVVLACNSDSDACPAACKEDNTDDEDEVVKAGDLDVETSGSSNGNMFIGRDSELDTITLKTSEEVTISRIVLERIGYSTKDNIVSVKLEDSKGATIADAKTLDSKGQVKLTLKKDYKVVDGELDAVIVVNTYNATTAAAVPGAKALSAGSTVGFKVVDVESTAKNVNISGKANTYTAIAYDGSTITFSNFNDTATKEYNWEAGNTYEVAKFRVKAPDDSSIILRGFTLAKNVSSLDLRKYFDSAEVTIAGEKVSGLEASVNKDDELVVTFKDVELAAKEKAEVIVKIALVEDFDQFTAGYNVVKLSLKDFVAVDGKVESRVSATNTNAGTPTYYGELSQYTFKGSKIKISNVKLGNVDGALNSEDVVVAEGNITVSEAIKGTFGVDVTVPDSAIRDAITDMTFVVNGEEYDGTITSDSGTTRTFTFTNVEIEKSGKIKFKVNIKDETTNPSNYNGKKVNFSIFKADSFTSLVYDESNKNAKSEVSGSITFSTLTIQAAKASLKNDTTKDVEFMNKESNRKVVFEGTYTAKKGDVELNEFAIASNLDDSTTPTLDDLAVLLNPATSPVKNKVTFYISIDGDEVADAKLVCDDYATPTKCEAADTFSKVSIAAGKEVKLKVEAEVEAENASANPAIVLGTYKVTVKGEDNNGNPAGEAHANTAKLKVVEKGSVTISAGETKSTVLKKASNQDIAAFTVKPSNGSSEIDLEEIVFSISSSESSLVDIASLDHNNVTVKVNGIVQDDCTKSSSTKLYTCSLNEKVESEGLPVVITLDNEYSGTAVVRDLSINTKSQSRTFKKAFVDSLVRISAIKDMGGTTQFTLEVDEDDDYAVSNLIIYFDTTEAGAAAADLPASVTDTNYATQAARTDTVAINGSFDDGETLEAKGIQNQTRMVTAIAYKAGSSATYVFIKKADFNDFFKVGDTYARTYQSNK